MVLEAEGDLDGALELLTDAERLYVGDFSPDVRPISAIKARVLIAQGRIAEAWGWARERGLSAADDLTYVHEFEHVTLARLLLAQGIRDRSDVSAGRGDRAPGPPPGRGGGGRKDGSSIEILGVLALARDAARRRPRREGRARARPGARRARGLRAHLRRRGSADGGPLRLVARVGRSGLRAPAACRLRDDLARAAVEQPLIEPLSERELEVLRLLDSDLDGPDIARELTVSLTTVRTHTRNIYAKLGVTSRRAAVSRGAELGLLSRTGDHRPPAAVRGLDQRRLITVC